jgi:hypothetical protein
VNSIQLIQILHEGMEIKVIRAGKRSYEKYLQIVQMVEIHVLTVHSFGLGFPHFVADQLQEGFL